MTSGGHEVEVGGGGGGMLPIYKLVCNKRQSEFLTGEVEYCMLFEHGPLPPTPTSRPPDYIHVIGFSPLFHFVYCTECKPKSKKQGGLGTKVGFSYLITSNEIIHTGSCNLWFPYLGDEDMLLGAYKRR